jgi:hypothetical protein
VLRHHGMVDERVGDLLDGVRGNWDQAAEGGRVQRRERLQLLRYPTCVANEDPGRSVMLRYQGMVDERVGDVFDGVRGNRDQAAEGGRVLRCERLQLLWCPTSFPNEDRCRSAVLHRYPVDQRNRFVSGCVFTVRTKRHQAGARLRVSRRQRLRLRGSSTTCRDCLQRRTMLPVCVHRRDGPVEGIARRVWARRHPRNPQFRLQQSRGLRLHW